MAQRARGDLLDRSMAAGQAGSIIVCRQIANQCRHPVLLTLDGQGLFQKRGLARARTGDQTHHKDHQLHGADSDIALDVGRHGCEQSDHSYGQGAPDELFLHFDPPVLRLRIFQIPTTDLLGKDAVSVHRVYRAADCRAAGSE